jgi:hypothetical protein
MKRTVKATFLGLCLAVLAASQTQAGLIFTITESGGNVVVNMSGNVNLSATLGPNFPTNVTNPLITPQFGNILIGPPGPSTAYQVNVAGWTSFGTGSSVNFSSSLGSPVSLFGGSFLGLPSGYVSGNPLSATGTRLGASFASLGITPGSYLTTFSNSATGVTISDTVRVNAVPEPCGLVLGLTAGVAGLFVRRRRGC